MAARRARRPELASHLLLLLRPPLLRKELLLQTIGRLLAALLIAWSLPLAPLPLLLRPLLPLVPLGWRQRAGPGPWLLLLLLLLLLWLLRPHAPLLPRDVDATREPAAYAQDAMRPPSLKLACGETFVRSASCVGRP